MIELPLDYHHYHQLTHTYLPTVVERNITVFYRDIVRAVDDYSSDQFNWILFWPARIRLRRATFAICRTLEKD